MALFTAIAAAVGAVGTFIGGLGAVGSFLLNTAVGVGLNLLAQAIAGKPKSAANASFGINGTLQAGGDVPRSFILGRSATAGSLAWANTWGQDGETPNAYLTQVIAIADLPGHLLEQVLVNGEQVTFGETPHSQYGYPVTQYRKGGADHLWLKWYDGTQTTADDFLVSTASNSNRQWESTRVGRGVTYVIATARISQNMFSGIPSFKFVVSGPKFYDPSKDSTVPGGSGSQRWNNPETWGGDGDHLPAVQIYNLLRGINYDGDWFYGLQAVTGARLPTAHWITQINKCRTDNTYRAGGEISVDVPLAPAIEALLTACQGRLSEVGGFYTVHVGEPDEPVASFSDGEILSTEGQSFTPFFGLSDTINGIVATYPSPADGWTEKPAPPLYRSDLEVLAGNRRLMADVSLSFVPYPEQVQRLMKSALAEGQRARRHTLVLPPEYWPYAVPGATLSWTSARNGYDAKWFRIDGAVDRANLDVMVDITEVDPDDYDWDTETDFQPPVDGALGILRPAPQPLVGWQVFPATIGSAGREIPSIRVAFNGNLDDVRAVRVQARLDGEDDPMFDGEVPYGDPATNGNPASITLSGTFAPVTAHQVRGIFIPYGSRVTQWSEWLPVTTPDVAWFDEYAQLALEMLTARSDAQASVAANFERFDDDIAALSAAIADLKEREVRQGAFISRQEVIRQTDTESFTLQMTAVNASLGAANALIVQEQLARVAGDLAEASARTILQTTVDGNSNSLSQLMSVSGGTKRYALVMATGNKVQTAISMDGSDTVGQIALAAGLLQVYDPDVAGGVPVNMVTVENVPGVGVRMVLEGTLITNAIKAGLVQAEKLSALSSDLGLITAGEIRNPAGTLIDDLPNMRRYRTDGKGDIDLKNRRILMLGD